MTNRMMPRVKTLEIYRGAVPFIALQVMVVFAVIMFPQLVTHYRGTHSQVDPNTIELNLPPLGGAESDGNGGGDSDSLPGLTLPSLDGLDGGGNDGSEESGSGPDSIGLPPLTLGGEDGAEAGGTSTGEGEEETAPNMDLSQPPSFE